MGCVNYCNFGKHAVTNCGKAGYRFVVSHLDSLHNNATHFPHITPKVKAILPPVHIIKSESRFTPDPPRAVIAPRRAEQRGDASMFPGRAGNVNTAQVRRKNSRVSLTENKQNTTVKIKRSF